MTRASVFRTRYRLASQFLLMYNSNYFDRQGLAMSEGERHEDQTERPSLWANERVANGVLPVGS
jgi:hypothetical protein